MSRTVFAIVGAKGGAGSTTLSIELVNRFTGKQRRTLVDGGLAGRRSHAVSFDAISQLDDNRLPGSPALIAFPLHDLLELTATYEDGFIVRADDVEAIFEKSPADAVFIVDAPQPFAAAVRPFIKRAVRFLVIVEPTLLGVSAARQMLTAMARFGIPRGRVVIVINSRDGNYEFKRSEIQSTLQTTVIADVPPRRDRSYMKVLQALADELQRVPHLEPLPDLRPSAATPMGNPGTATTAAPSAELVGAALVSPTKQTTPVGLPSAKAREPISSSREEAKAQIHEALLARIDFSAAARMHTDANKMTELRSQVNDIATELVSNRRDVGSVEDAARIKQEVIEEALGLGPIESLMGDPSVTEIMVNGVREIYVERRGKIELTPKRFVDTRQLRLVIERVLAPLGRRIDESSPMVDARLADGSRINATIEPLSIDGPTLTIRRFGTRRLGIDDLTNIGAVTLPIVDFLRAGVQARLNVVISGGTGSGKTTLLNAVSGFIPSDERIITIEDAAELLLDQPHVIRLETRPPNLEGRGEIRIRDCVRNALRMRPDRIVVGECRGEEALDMLQAMNTGHDGSLTTVHANTPRDALARIETMVLMAGYDLPVRAIREQVSSAIDLVIQIARMSDGTRKMVSLSEVVGMEGDVVTMQELMRYRQRGIDSNRNVVGAFESTGVQPSCLQRFGELGIDFDPVAFGLPTQVAWSAR